MFLYKNEQIYKHLEITVLVSESKLNELYLAIPTLQESIRISFWDYFLEGLNKRNLLLKHDALKILYSSLMKSYSDIDEALDILSNNFPKFVEISKKDISKYIVLSSTVYPRNVLIDYINMRPYRKSKLEKCLSDISLERVLYSMIKNCKDLHKKKNEYLVTGIGSTYIKNLNTKNLNYMYYTLCVSKPYYLNDIVVLLNLYERGVSANDILFKNSY